MPTSLALPWASCAPSSRSSPNMTIALCTGPTTPATRGTVFLPFVAVAPVDPVSVFYDLLLHDSRQQRPRLDVCEVLQSGAMRRAHGLANGQPWAHVDAQGRHSNGIARAFGCSLPLEYSDGANYIESLCAGSADATVMIVGTQRSSPCAFVRRKFIL